MQLNQQIERLKKLSKELDKPQPLNDLNVDMAWKNRGLKPETKSDVFYLLTILNLLNTAVKQKEFMKTVHYGGIKPNVSRLINSFLKRDDNELIDDFWVNPQEGNCAYVVIYGLQFTFHHITINDELKDFVRSPRNINKPWEGVRLQWIANDLFQLAQINRLGS